MFVSIISSFGGFNTQIRGPETLRDLMIWRLTVCCNGPLVPCPSYFARHGELNNHPDNNSPCGVIIARATSAFLGVMHCFLEITTITSCLIKHTHKFVALCYIVVILSYLLIKMKQEGSCKYSDTITCTCMWNPWRIGAISPTYILFIYIYLVSSHLQFCIKSCRFDTFAEMSCTYHWIK